MKSIVFSVCVVLSCSVSALDPDFVEKFMEQVQEVGERCMKEVGATSEDIAELVAHKLPTSHSGKCMIFCFHKHFNIQHDDGSIDEQGAIDSLEPLKDNDKDLYDKIIEVFHACRTVESDPDPCVFATKIAECAVKEGKARGIDESMFA